MNRLLRLLSFLFLVGAAGLIQIAAAPAHTGPHGPAASIWSMWTPDPIGIFGPLVFGFLYFNGLKKWPHGSHPVRFWQRASFVTGQLAVFAALVSPIDALSDQFFFMHQIQHLLLRVLAPVLILVGAPLTPVLRGLPEGALQGLVRPVAGNRRMRALYARLTHPLIALGLFIGTLWVWQIQELQNLVVRSTAVHLLMHFTMFGAAMLYWWLVIDPAPHRSRIHYGMRVLYVAITIIPNTVLGAMIVFSGVVLYGAYGDSVHVWPLSSINDQLIGGLILWLPMEMMSVIIAGIVFVMWFLQEEKEGTAQAVAELARRRRLPKPVAGPAEGPAPSVPPSRI